ncbi:MAG: hypothetical protein KatS3mg024_0829 [Armatimonadota bacterium]|nr:MAG: hypothetical protein KatS3mg024_0829 [Armatimonadota bacterium]
MSASDPGTSSAPPHRPRLIWAIRRAAGDFYDRLGLMVLASAVMMLFPAMAVMAGQALRSVAGPTATGMAMFLLAWYGLACGWGVNILIAHRIAYFLDPGPDAFRDFARTFLWPSLKLGTLQLVLTMVMLVDAAFFLSRSSLLLKIAGMLMAYLLLLWLLMQVWQWPFLITEEGGVWKAVRKSGLLLLDNPFFTLGTFSVTMTAGALLLLSGIGAVVALGGLGACFIVRAHRELLMKYGVVEDEPEVIEDTGWPSSNEPPRRLNPRDYFREPDAGGDAGAKHPPG